MQKRAFEFRMSLSGYEEFMAVFWKLDELDKLFIWAKAGENQAFFLKYLVISRIYFISMPMALGYFGFIVVKRPD